MSSCWLGSDVESSVYGKRRYPKKITMTAHVVMSAPQPEKIAMTAPGVMSPHAEDREMAFLLTSKYKTVEEAPEPKNQAVDIELMADQVR